jgi:cysteine-rich repeat protein
MRLGSFILSLSAIAGILIATQTGCGIIGGNDATKEDKLCTPGAFVFCRCADRSEGTKLCKTDGKSFDACQTQSDGECVGGEIPDERTNEEIPGGENPDGKDPEPKPSSNPIDTCPGKSTSVTPGTDIIVEGDTKSAVNDRKGKQGACAVGTGAKDHVYHLIATGSGSLDVKVQGSDGLNPTAYIRTNCDDVESQAVCGPPGANNLAQFKTNVVTGKDYFLVIDGASGSAGKYKVTMKLTTGSFCGDGKVDQGEACDDGNHEDNDGCGPDCRKINGNPATGGSCPGHPVDVWTGQTFTGSGSTNSYGNTWNAPASSACSVDTSGTNTYSDHIYAVMPHANGTLTVTLSAPAAGTLANFMISARRSCSSVGTDKTLCTNVNTGGSGETLNVPVTANQVVYIGIDGGGISNNKGDYGISFKLQ